MSSDDFRHGGLVPGQGAPPTIAVDECIVSAKSVLAGRPMCMRRDRAHLDAVHGGEQPRIDPHRGR